MVLVIKFIAHINNLMKDVEVEENEEGDVHI